MITLLVFLFSTGLVVFIIKLIMGKAKCPSNARVDGKTIIITGANRGIGKSTTIELARRGGKIIMACRNFDAAQEVAETIKKETGNQNITPMKLDLSSFQSIKSFAQEINSKEDKIDILINNAGMIGSSERKLTQDGYEMHFQTNHLGPFYLTKLLLPKIQSSASSTSPARIINLASEAHQFCRTLDLDDVNFEKSYSPFWAYSITKLMNILFSNYLAGQLKDSNVTVNSLHPGAVDTELLYRFTFGRIMSRLFGPVLKLFVKNEEEGAQTTIYCAVEPSLDTVTGKYFDNCKEKRPSGLARDLALAKKLWDLSEKLVESISNKSDEQTSGAQLSKQPANSSTVD